MSKNEEKEEVKASSGSEKSASPKILHRPRARRKMLASMVAGTGAVVAGKLTPTEWKRPVINAVLVPAHAQATGFGSADCTATMDCGAFGDASEGGDREISAGDGWLPGSTIVLDGFDCDADEINLDTITADLDGTSTTDLITLSITGNMPDDTDDGQGSVQMFPAGTNVDLSFDAAGDEGGADDGTDPTGIFSAGSSVDLVLTFTNPCTEDCVISFQFNCVE